MAFSNFVETPSISPLSTPPPSTPLHLSGFLTGDTIQVEGDTGNLQFSVKFNVQKKHTPPENPFQYFSGASTPDHYTPLNSNFTPIFTHDEEEGRTANSEPIYNERNMGISRPEECDTTMGEKSSNTVTRLRSGVLSAVKYFPGKIQGGNLRTLKLGKKEALEKVLRRRSLPVRPCTSYSLFVMVTWGLMDKSSSFGETSKRLSEIWCKLPPKDRKVYEQMAMKDNVRYKRQCKLLRSKGQGV